MVKTNKQRLDEVRLTLQQLQRIAIDPADVPQSAERPISLPVKILKFAQASSLAELGKASLTTMFIRGREAVIGALAIGAVCLAGIAIWLFMVSRWDNAGISASHFSADRPNERMQMSVQETAYITTEAQRLIDSGKVAIARQQLESIAKLSPEAALILARSYDPNFLRLISEPDAPPDPREAERWYRIWRDIAAERGMVMETERLERIINAMYSNVEN